MNEQMMGLIGGIAGCAVGILGGAFGCWCAIRGTRGPRERAYVVRMCFVFTLLCSLFVAAMFALPTHLRGWLWLPYGPALVWAVTSTNRRQARIRAEEAPRPTD